MFRVILQRVGCVEHNQLTTILHEVCGTWAKRKAARARAAEEDTLWWWWWS